MSNVNLHNIMGTNTLNNIKAALLAAVALFGVAAVPTSAQDVCNVVATNGFICGERNGVEVVSDYNASGVKVIPGSSALRNFQRTPPQNIKLYKLEENGDSTLLDVLNIDNAVDGISPAGYIGPEGTRGALVTYRCRAQSRIYGGIGSNAVKNDRASWLRYVNVLSQNAGDGNFGHTFILSFEMSDRVTVGWPISDYLNIYFDAVGGEDNQAILEDATGAYVDYNGDFFVSPCPGSGDVELKIANDRNPFKDDSGDPLKSYLGNTYSATYSWERASDAWGRSLGVVSSNSSTYVDDFVTSQAVSGYVEYQPRMLFYQNGEATQCGLSFLSRYAIYYFTPLQLKNAFDNLTSGVSKSGSDVFYACYGDDVRYTPTFIQNALDAKGGYSDQVCQDGEVVWSIAKLDDEGNIIDTLLDKHEYYSGEYFDFSALEETATYKVTCEYIDPSGYSRGAVSLMGDANGDGLDVPDPCPTEQTFTIYVRQTSATATLDVPEIACEESDPEFAATVTSIPAGDKIEDYAFRWYHASGDRNGAYDDLNTTDWVDNGEEGWSDPRNTVKTVFRDIFRPASGPYQFIKFSLANTYKIDGTTYYCPIDFVDSVDVKYLPVLEPVDDVVACEGQPVAFKVSVTASTATSDDVEPGSKKGMTYEVFLDEACTQPATDVICLAGPDEIDYVTDEYSAPDYNTARTGRVLSRFAWFGLKSCAKSGYTFYVRVKQELFGCYSHPVKVKIVTVPSPQVESVKADPVSYCQNADASELKVTATVNNEYLSFVKSSGLALAPLSYHWQWFSPKGDVLGEKVVEDNNVLDGVFDDNAVTKELGKVDFRVYLTDSYKCGYKLNFNGDKVEGADSVSTKVMSGVLTVTPRPKFSIEENVVACGDAGKVEIEFKSLDSRSLVFNVTPKEGTTVASTNSPVNVSGNSTQKFIVNYDEGVVKADQLFEFDVTVNEVGGLGCDTSATFSFTVYERPKLQSPVPVNVCYGQEAMFTLSFAENIAVPAEGLTYQLFQDSDCKVTLDSVLCANADNHRNIVPATQGKETYWLVSKFFTQSIGAGKSIIFFARLTDERTGCHSDVVPIEIRVLPLPEITSLQLDPTAFCKDADASSLVATAELESGFENFNYNNWGLEKPSLTYHWSWTDGEGAELGSKETTVGKLTDAFAGLTSKAGQATFKVTATGSDGCGYEFEYDGRNLRKTDKIALKAAEAKLTINTLPDFSIEEGVKACSDQGVVEVNLSSNDGRNLEFSFTPVSGAPAPTMSVVNVAGNSSAKFSTTINVADVKDVTTYTYDVKVKDNTALACEDDATLSFTAYPVPSLAISPAADKRFVCQGGKIELSVKPSLTENGKPATSFDYVWAVDGAVVADASASRFVYEPGLAVASGNHAVTITVSHTFADGHVCSTTQTFNVFVNPLPVVDFSADVTICEGNSATLVASVTNAAEANHLGAANNFSYVVTPSVADISADASGAKWTLTVSPTSTQKYTFKVTNSVSGCSSVEPDKEVTVTVDRKAHVKLNGLSETEVCEGVHTIEIDYSVVNPSEFGSIDFSSLAVNGFTVVGHTDSQITISGNLAVGSISLGSATMSATTDKGCDVVFDNSLTLKVNPIPAAPVVSTPADLNVCYHENKTLSFEIAQQKGFWYEIFVTDAPTQPDAAAGADKVLKWPNASPYDCNTKDFENDKYVWIRVIDANNKKTLCPSAFAGPFHIIVNKIETPEVAPIATICENETATITVVKPLNDATHNYEYRFVNASGVLQSGPSTSYTTANLSSSASYNVKATDTNTGCESEWQTVEVNVHKKPIGSGSVEYQDAAGSSSVSLPLGGSVSREAFCEGEAGKAIVSLSADLQDVGDTFTSTLVSVSDGSVSDWAKDSETQWSCSKPAWNADVTLTFSVKDALCESNTFTVTVKVEKQISVPSVTMDLAEFCKGEVKPYVVTVNNKADYSSDIRFVYYIRSKADQTVLSGPLAGTGFTFSATTEGIEEDVEIFAYAYNVKTGCMSPVSNVLDLHVNKLPVPTISQSATVVCPDEDVTLTVNEDYVSYKWLNFDPTRTTKSITTPVSATTTFRVTVVDEKGCESEEATATVTVHPRPEFTITASPDIVCQGSNETVNFTITPVNDDVIDFEDRYTFTVDAPSSMTVGSRVNAQGKYEYFVEGQQWTDASVTFRATVRSTAAFNSCESNPVPVTVSVIPSLTRPDAFSTSPQNGAKTKDVHVCEDSNDPLTVFIDNVNAYPTTGGVSYSYHWYSDAAGNNELVDGEDYQVSPNGSITFVPKTSTTIFAKVVREVEPFCSSELSEAVNITIEKLPSTPVPSALSFYVCQPEDSVRILSLSVVSPITGYKYHWYRQSDGEVDDDMSDDPEVAVSGGSAPATIAAPKSDTYLYVIAESPYGCFSAVKSQIVKVTVGGNPEIITVNKPKEVLCSGDELTFTVDVKDNKENVSYEYEVTSEDDPAYSQTGIIDASGVFSSFDFNVDEAQYFTIKVWALYDGHCRSLNNVEYRFLVNGKPTDDGLRLKPSLCEGSTMNDADFELKNLRSHSYEPKDLYVTVVASDLKTILAESDAVPNGGTCKDFINPSQIKRAHLPLYYIITDGNCQSEPKLVNIKLEDIPNFSVTNDDGKVDQTPDVELVTLEYCDREEMHLRLENELPDVDSNGEPVSYYYQWVLDNDTIVGEVGKSLSRKSVVAGLYTLVVKSSNGSCSSSRDIKVEVHPLPDPIILPVKENNKFCTDGSLELATLNKYKSYKWEILTDPTITIIKDAPDTTLTYPVRDLNLQGADIVEVNLWATDEFGCTNVDVARWTAELVTPPVISDVKGLDACGENPFVLQVSTDKTDYTVELYDNAGNMVSAVFDAASGLLTTDANLAEGDYSVRVIDAESECWAEKVVHLSRYDLYLEFDNSDNYICQNDTVILTATLTDYDHDDVLSKLQNVKISAIYSHNEKDGRKVYYVMDPVDMDTATGSYTFRFVPKDGVPVLPPDDELSYDLDATATFEFSTSAPGTVMACSKTGNAKIRIIDTPVLVSSPVMPVCLGSDIDFSVDMTNVKGATPTFKFFVNGVQVINANGDYSSNVFSTRDHNEIELKEGDVVTALVSMSKRDILCTSNEIVVSYHADFKPVIADVDLTKDYCKGSDIEFSVTSVLPDGAVEPFVLSKIKSYVVYIVNADGTETKKVEKDGVDALTDRAKFVYEGDQTSIVFYAVVKDENDCEVKTDPVTIKINQFRIVDVVASLDGSVMPSNDLCADVDYAYKAIIEDGDGNVIEPGSNYDFTFVMDGVEWSDHTSGSYLSDTVVKSHPKTDAPISLVVNVKNLLTGCETTDLSLVYPAYKEEFSYHAKPEPNEKFKDDFLPISDDVADTAKFEICHDDDFGFDVNGDLVTVVYDGQPVETYRNGVRENSVGSDYLEISASYQPGTPGLTTFLFNMKPSKTWHTISFIVDDGACKVSSADWWFRKFEKVTVEAINEEGLNIIDDNNELTVCESDSVTFVPSTTEPDYTRGYVFKLGDDYVSSEDFTATAWKGLFAPGDHELVIKPDFGRNGCEETVIIHSMESPKPAVTVVNVAEDKVLVPDGVDSYTWSYSFCEKVEHSITFDGAKSYQVTAIERDGVDVSAEYGAGLVNSITRAFDYVENDNSDDYSTYTFYVDFVVGNCMESGVIIAKVYKQPEAEFINGTPKKLVIAGAEVPVDVTPGYNNYQFIINGTTVQNGPDSSLPGSMNKVEVGTTNVTVIVSNDFGCSITLEADITVLDGVAAKDVVTSSDFYCSEDNGVTISVVDPQVGITYFVDGRDDLQHIKCDGTNAVAWENVRIANMAVNPETFVVKAYYDELPEQTFEMNNVVTVEEVTSPTDATVDDLLARDCSEMNSSFVWKVSNTNASNSYWLVSEDGEAISDPIMGNGGVLDFPVYDIFVAKRGAVANGKYRIVARSQRQNGDWVCDKLLNGTLTIDLPESNAYEVKMTPQNGRLCVSDAAGITIYIEQSDYDEAFAHKYILFCNGVEVASKESVEGGGEIRFENIIPGVSGVYTYTVVCEFSGCRQPMANSVVVTVFDEPMAFTMSASNDGFYCYDDNSGPSIFVSGQQEGYIYKLLRDGVETGRSWIGDASGSQFSFDDVKEEGRYTVEVSIPDIDGEPCKTLIDGNVNIKMVPEPKNFTATISNPALSGMGTDKLSICIGEEAQVHVSGAIMTDLDGLVSYNYELRASDGSLISDVMENIDANNGVFSFPTMTEVTPGVYTYTIVAKSSLSLSDGSVLECSKAFEAVVELTVKKRPNTGETVTVDYDANPADPCYGADIVIVNPNTDPDDAISYELYKLDDDGNEASIPVSVIKPYEGDEPRFKNIKDGKGYYRVKAYNGVCRDDVDPVVLVELDKFAKVQEVEFEDFICQGDPGVEVRMKDTEENVVYTLYYISPELFKQIAGDAGVIPADYLAENVPGVPLSTSAKAAYDHQRLFFKNIDFGDGTPVSDLIDRDGYYYAIALKDVANACPVASPLKNFQTLELPKSFSLVKSQLYCYQPGADVFIEDSEYDADAVITYRLYSRDAEGNLTFFTEVTSNPGGGKLQFPVPVPAGDYEAIAVKRYSELFNGHVCTSAMRSQITITLAPALDDLKFGDKTLVFCYNDNASFELAAEDVNPALEAAHAQVPSIDGITFYMTRADLTPEEDENVMTRFFDGNADVSFAPLSAGAYTVWASYGNFDCLVKLGSVVINKRDEIPTNVVNEVVCGNSYSVDPAYLVNGVTYVLIDTDTDAELQSVSYDGITVKDVSFTDIPAGNYRIDAYFSALPDDCRATLGKIVVRGIVPADYVDELTLCASEPIVYDMPAALLYDGAYYYVTDTAATSIPSDYASELYRYTGGGSLRLTNLKDGMNTIWMAFNGYECLTPLIKVNVIRHPEIPSNVVADKVCGLTYSLTAGLVNGVTYALYDESGAKVAEQVCSDAETALDFTVASAGAYEIRGSIGGLCESVVGSVVFRGYIDVAEPITAILSACGSTTDAFELTAPEYVGKLVEGLTYYLLEAGKAPSEELVTGRRYETGATIVYRGLQAGDYDIWASYDNYGCETKVGSLHVGEVNIEDVELVADWSCDGQISFSISSSIAGVNYQLYAVAKDKTETLIGDAQVGTGEELVWSGFTYDSNVNRYVVKAAAGSCPQVVVGSLYRTGIRQDFDLVTANFYYTGGGCTGEAPTLVLDESVIGIKYYLTLADGVSTEPLEGTVKDGDGGPLTWNVTGQGVVTYRLHAYKGDLATTTCISADNTWRDVTINFDAVTFPVGHLVARNDILDYCAGETGIRLGYVNEPRKGELYRLYKVTDDEWGRELVDIQEIPSYMNIYQPTDTLFFNGWGYNESSKEYATAGRYFVEVTSAQGCVQASDTVDVIEQPLPAAPTDSVFYAFIDENGMMDEGSANNEYGVIGGSVVYRNARPGNTYYLVKDGVVIESYPKTVTVEGELVFGPIKEVLTSTVTKQDSVAINDSGICYGEGVYSVLVRNDETSCESTVGDLTFVAEDLVAYNVQIYLNKNEMARTIDLVPRYDAASDISYKGNHMYIDWSSRIDKVYRPVVITGNDGYYVNDNASTEALNETENPSYFSHGYTNKKGTYNATTHKFTGVKGSSNVWFNIVNDPDKKVSGTYGFINVDYIQGGDTSVIQMSTPTGYFYYMKQPSFYGREEIEYYIENRQMPGRVSNTAKITILCGNEETGDSVSVFLIPNAFSPNGDGLNDYFKIIIPDQYQDNSESKLQVFNRWGTLVYRSKGLRYGEDESWWDGSSSTSNMVTLGEKLPSGTYYYVFSITFIDKQHATRSERKMHGYVELRR